MKAVPKASYTDERGFGTVRQKCRDTSPSPTTRDAPWEHDRGEKPQGSGAQSVPCYVRIVGMGKKLMPKAICKTVCRTVVHWQVVKLPHTDLGTRLAAHRLDGRARTMFVCDAPPLVRRPEHRIDRLTPIRPQMGRLLEHGASANGLTRCMQARSAPARAECAHRRAFKVHAHCLDN